MGVGAAVALGAGLFGARQLQKRQEGQQRKAQADIRAQQEAAAAAQEEQAAADAATTETQEQADERRRRALLSGVRTTPLGIQQGQETVGRTRLLG